MRLTTFILAVIIGGVCTGIILLRQNLMPAGANTPPQARLVSDDPSPVSSVTSPQFNSSEIAGTGIAQDSILKTKLNELLSDLGRLSHPSDEAVQMQLQRFVEGISLAELPEVLRALCGAQKKYFTASGKDLQMRLLQRWAENDPKSAAAWATESPDMIRQEAISKAAGAWAESDLSDAVAWATQLPDGEDRQTAVMQVASEAVYRDPMQALKLASALPADAERDDVIAQASSAWAAKAPEDAVAWVKEIPDAGLRDQSLSFVAIAWADTNPASAAELVATSLSSSKLQSRAVMAIVQRWAIKDSKAVAEWVDLFPAGELRDTSIDILNDTAQRLNSPFAGQ